MRRATRSTPSGPRPSAGLTAALQWEKWTDMVRRRWRVTLVVVAAVWFWLPVLYLRAAGWVMPHPWLGMLTILTVGFGWLYRRWSVRYRGELIAYGKDRPRLAGLHLFGEWRVAARRAALLGRVRSQYRAGCLKFGLTYKAKGTGPRPVEYEPYLRNLRVTPDGDVAASADIGRVFLKPGEFGAKGPEFAASVRALSFVVKPVGRGGVDFVWRFTDELDRTLLVKDLPLGPKGRDTVGRTMNQGCLSLPRHLSWLIVGQSGSGKSELMNTAVADWLRTGQWIDLYVFDPKGGQQWGWLRRLGKVPGCRIRVVEFLTPVDGPKAVVDMVKRALKVVQARQTAAGVDDGGDDWTPTPTVESSQENPRIVVFIDELLEVPQILTDTKTAPSPLVRFISVARSGNGMAICMSQDGTKEAIGNARDRFGYRLALRLPSQPATMMVLHPSAVDMGARNWEISEDTPGVGYGYDNESGVMTKFRLAYTSPQTIRDDLQYGRIPAAMPTAAAAAGPELPDVAVYRIYGRTSPTGAGRVLLYVGRSNDPARREDEHRRDQPWRAEIDLVKWDWCDDDAAAKVEEERQIRMLHPKYNVQLNGKSRTKRWESVPTDEPDPSVSVEQVRRRLTLRPWSKTVDQQAPTYVPYPVAHVNGHHPAHEGSE